MDQLLQVLVTALLTAIGAPAILWFATKGKLSDLFMPRPELEGELEQLRGDLLKDVNLIGAKHDALLNLFTGVRTHVDDLRDRCTVIESRHDPVIEGVRRVEKKLDQFIDRHEEHSRQLATHAEQIRTLFNRGQG